MSLEKETAVLVAFTGEEVSALVDAINVRHATSFVALNRYRSGDGTGAYRLEGAGGRTYVLKCVRGEDTGPVERAETATAFLRGRGYPAPEHVCRTLSKRTSGECQPTGTTSSTSTSMPTTSWLRLKASRESSTGSL